MVPEGHAVVNSREDRCFASGEVCSRAALPVVRGLILLAWLLCEAACAVFPMSESEPPPTRLAGHVFGDVTYEVINSSAVEDSGARRLLELMLSHSGNFRSITNGPARAAWHIQISFEEYPGSRRLLALQFEEHPGRFALRVINDHLAGATFFVFPILPYLERSVHFDVWRQGALKRSYRYDRDYLVVFGWTSLLLVPWSQLAAVRMDMATVARRFLSDAARDGMLAP